MTFTRMFITTMLQSTMMYIVIYTASQPFKVGDGFCDGNLYNVSECGFDGGDCIGIDKQLNIDYLYCDAYFPTALGNGRYRGDYNARECGLDSGDCLLINIEIQRWNM